MVGGNVQARWLSDGRFWYTSTTLSGSEPAVVDPVRRTRTKATKADTGGSRTTEVGGIAPRGGGGPRTGGAAGVLSPDGKRAAFIKDWNLWVRDVATKQERQLTTDGVTNFGYATDNAGWARSDPPFSSGLRILERLRRSSKTSGKSATFCSRLASVNRSCTPGSTPSRATRSFR